MKNSPLIAVLIGALFVSSLVSVGFAFRWVSASRELRSLQSQAAAIQNNRIIINSLVAEVSEYGKKNPAIVPILESVTPKAGRSNAVPAGPAKPGAK